MELIQALLVQLAALGGVAALIAFIVNALKRFGVVKDGQAKTFAAGLNLVALAGLLIAGVVAPNLDIFALDSLAGQIAAIGTMVLTLVIQVGVSGKVHNVVSDIPVVGFSYSSKEMAALEAKYRAEESKKEAV